MRRYINWSVNLLSATVQCLKRSVCVWDKVDKHLLLRIFSLFSNIFKQSELQFC